MTLLSWGVNSKMQDITISINMKIGYVKLSDKCRGGYFLPQIKTLQVILSNRVEIYPYMNLVI